MATYGKVKPFNPKADDLEVYEEQLRFYMVANNITDAAKKRSILLTVCGDQTFKLLRSLVPDGKLDADDITFNSLLGLLKSHYKKKQSVVVHRFNFNTRASAVLLQPATIVAVFTWLLSVHTKRRCAGTAKRKATWTGCAVLRLALLQRVTPQPLLLIR